MSVNATLTLAPTDARAMLQANRARLLDVREPDEYRHERIPGATLAPLSSFDATSIAAESNRTIIVHCRSGKRSADAAQRLRAAGHEGAVSLAGGIEAWKSAGLPVQRPTRAPFPVMRQVQVVIGVLLLASVALIAFVSPWFAIVPAFLGAGLTMAGLSGWCGMAHMLSVMPWNRA